MKSKIFNSAILSRRKLKFLYRLNQVELKPYFLAINKKGEIVVSGRANNLTCKKVFKFNKKFNINVNIHPNFSLIVPKYIIYN